MRLLFEDFEEVIVSFSTGKDSTVILELARIVAQEKGRRLKVLFLDQEAEWTFTVDYMRKVAADPGLECIWVQHPFKLFNVTSQDQHYLHCWEPGADWMRDKEPGHFKLGFDFDSFHSFFALFSEHYFSGKKVAWLSGMRTEESPGRFMGATTAATYKWITWAKRLAKGREHYTFHPIYDWAFTDVWKAIFDNGWQYNRLYDRLYQLGLPIRQMRVSNLTNDTALDDLTIMQEIDPKAYEGLIGRLKGIRTAGRMSDEGGYFLKKLPFMFGTWEEYALHLADKLLADDETKAKYLAKFEKFKQRLIKNECWEGNEIRFWKQCAKTVVMEDHYFTKMASFESSLNLNIRRKDYNFFNRDELI